MRATSEQVARVVIDHYEVESHYRYQLVSMRTRTALDVTRRAHSRTAATFRPAVLVISWAGLPARLLRRRHFALGLVMQST